jgi:hypothetical protein
MAKEKIQVPLSFELGWQRQEIKSQAAARTEQPPAAQRAVS